MQHAGTPTSPIAGSALSTDTMPNRHESSVAPHPGARSAGSYARGQFTAAEPATTDLRPGWGRASVARDGGLVRRGPAVEVIPDRGEPVYRAAGIHAPYTAGCVAVEHEPRDLLLTGAPQLLGWT